MAVIQLQRTARSIERALARGPHFHFPSGGGGARSTPPAKAGQPAFITHGAAVKKIKKSRNVCFDIRRHQFNTPMPQQQR